MTTFFDRRQGLPPDARRTPADRCVRSCLAEAPDGAIRGTGATGQAVATARAADRAEAPVTPVPGPDPALQMIDGDAVRADGNGPVDPADPAFVAPRLTRAPWRRQIA